MVNVVIGIIGLASIVVFLLLSGKNGFTAQEQFFSSLLILTITILLNLLTSFVPVSYTHLTLPTNREV